MKTDFKTLLNKLSENDFDFVLVGGFAAAAYGSSYVTHDLDICAVLSPGNIEIPEDLHGINNLYLQTDVGVLDIISNVIGAGDFAEVLKSAVEIQIFGHNCKVISLKDLIRCKQTLKRPKDLLVAAELEVIQQKESPQLSISKAKECLSEVEEFYKHCGRAVSLMDEDTLVLAKQNSKLVGVVRLCFEENVYILRTMQVRNDLQGKGIGRMILQEFEKLLRDKQVQEVFCMPYDYLESFYGLIDFKKIDQSEAPAFLQERAESFHRRHADKKVILMRKLGHV